jgi:oxygen-dependent protoporphyrinogen oxidase
MPAETSGAPSPADVCIVGAGMAGLVVAAETAAAGLRAVVLEASDNVGGMLAPVTIGGDAGVTVDAGAESFATRTTGVTDLIDRWHLPVTVTAPNPAGAWLVAGGDSGIRRAPLPRRSVLGIPADPRAADILALVPPRAERLLPVPAEEPSLYDIVAARLGDDLASAVVDTVCRGVYSRSARDLKLSVVHPQLWQRFVQSGSLTDAVAQLAAGPRPGSAVAGIVGGMWRLPVELAARARAAGAIIMLDTPVHRVHGAGAGGDRAGDEALNVDAGSFAIRARTVVIATGRDQALRLLGEHSDGDGTPVELAIALVRSPGLDVHPVGTGALIADAAPIDAKALTHANAKWGWIEQQLEPHHHVVRLSARDGVTGAFDEASVATAISVVTGVSVAAEDVRELHVRRWDASSSSSTSPVVAADPRLHLAGAAVAGTGLASVVPHAREVAATLIHALAAPPLASAAS